MKLGWDIRYFHLYLNRDTNLLSLWLRYIAQSTTSCSPLYKMIHYNNSLENVFYQNNNHVFNPTRWKLTQDLSYIQFYWNIEKLEELGYKNGLVPIAGNFILIRTKFKNIFFCLIRLQMILSRIRRRRKKHLFLCATISHELHTPNQFTKITGCGPIKQRIYQYI